MVVERPRRPTMHDVAKRAGVSVKTVSRVINSEPNVAEHLAGRVLTAAAELGFRRNDIARTLRSSQSSRTIGLLIEEIANPFYSTIAGVVADVATAHETCARPPRPRRPSRCCRRRRRATSWSSR